MLRFLGQIKTICPSFFINLVLQAFLPHTTLEEFVHHQIEDTISLILKYKLFIYQQSIGL